MVSKRLMELDIILPEVNPAVASYVPAKLFGNQVLISGQLPMQVGNIMLDGPLNKNSDLDLARSAMRQCFLNGLAAATLVVDLDALQGVLQMGAFICSTAEFTDQHLVANGASNLAQEIFGKSGQHTRFAVGVNALPLGASVELSIIFQV